MALQIDDRTVPRPAAQRKAAPPADLRVVGGVRARIDRLANADRIASLREWGGYRLRALRSSGPFELAWSTPARRRRRRSNWDSFNRRARASAMVGAAAAERIYRSADARVAEIAISANVASGATLHWIPQETILFHQARLRRRFEVDLSADGRFLAVESIVFGRGASGETAIAGALNDAWRIRRDGRLAYADALRFEGALSEMLAERAIGGGARVVTTLVLAAPDAEDRLTKIRSSLSAADGRVEAAASAWPGLLTARLLAPTTEASRAALVTVLPSICGAAAPRSWN